MPGLTSIGFVPKTYDETKASINLILKPLLGSGTETDQESLYALFRNAITLELTELWESQQSSVNQRGISKAEGVQLDNEASVVGVKRVGASSSVLATVEATGSEGSVLPQFYQMTVSSTGEIFQTLIEYTLPAVGSQPLIVSFTAIEKGPIVCLSGELIGSLPIGFTTITNPDDATVGAATETDEEFRVSYPQRLARIGGGSLISIVEEVRLVVNISSVTGRENRTGAVDINGLDPYSFEIVVSGGADIDIANAIYLKSSAGGPSFGNTSVNISYEGNTYPIKFSRPVDISIWVEVDITSVNGDFPVDGDVLIEALILEYGDSLVGGDDVLLAKLQQAVTTIDGILAYTLKFDTITPPVNQTLNISIDDTERADFDSSRTTVTIP